MKRVIIYAEGQTEEAFVREVLYEYFLSRQIIVTVKTFGGISSYDKVLREVKRLCKQDKSAIITTFVDFYAFPTPIQQHPKFKDYANGAKDCYEVVERLEMILKADVNENNFIPFVMLHEFEAIVLIEPTKLLDEIENISVENLSALVANFGSPEEINQGKETAPSKRIIKEIRQYNKILHGVAVAKSIGIEEIQKRCPHFKHWIDKLLLSVKFHFK